jgi:hypothetical protein
MLGICAAEARRLQIDRSGPFFAVFLPHSLAMGLQIRQKLCSPGPIFAFDAFCRADSWIASPAARNDEVQFLVRSG